MTILYLFLLDANLLLKIVYFNFYVSGGLLTFLVFQSSSCLKELETNEYISQCFICKGEIGISFYASGPMKLI